MALRRSTPQPEQLTAIARLLGRWQVDPWSGHLHPGDLGWHCAVGADQMAQDLRVWERHGEPVAVGMLDGSEVLRLAVAPAAADDLEVAECIASDLDRHGADLCAGGELVVEARGATALVGYDPAGVPVAVTTVWSAGRGRPGLVEPMGVHRDHHGQGYGVAITLAGAQTLHRLGASSVVVVAESSNPAALATYRSAGFSSLGEVTDLQQGAAR